MNIVKKIDRVKTHDELNKIISCGANFICVELFKNDIFNDDRKVNKETAKEMKEVLKNVKFVGDVTSEKYSPDLLLLIDEIGFDYVQFSATKLPPKKILHELKRREIGVIYSGITASYDDDPSWILSRFDDNDSKCSVSFFQIDLLGDIEKSWQTLKSNSQNELQTSDVVNIGKENPIILTLDYSSDNILDICSSIYSSKGISMAIGDAPTKNDVHYFNFESIIKVLSSF